MNHKMRSNYILLSNVRLILRQCDSVVSDHFDLPMKIGEDTNADLINCTRCYPIEMSGFPLQNILGKWK